MGGKLYNVKQGQDADLGDVTVNSLAVNGNTVAGGLLLGTSEVVDLNGEADALVLDANGDTTISAPTDDQIDIEINGADDFTFTANKFTALASSVIETDTINETTSAAGVTIDGVLVKDNTITALRDSILTKSADYTLTAADSGKLIVVTGADKVMTLPATVAGLKYKILLAAAGLSAGTGLSISPNASDKIMGNGFTSADNKDAILAGSGDREGDFIEVTGDGVDGWYITDVLGTWTREA